MKITRHFELTDEEHKKIKTFNEFLDDLWEELDNNDAGTNEIEANICCIQDTIDHLVEAISDLNTEEN